MRAIGWMSPLYLAVTAAVWLGSADAPLSFRIPNEALASAVMGGRDGERGFVELVVRDAETGLPLPARARVEGRFPSFTPDLGPADRATGARDTVVFADGRATIPLGAGRYRLRVTRGPEWSVAERDVAVRSGATARVVVTLRRVLDPGDHVAADLHLHAAPSPDSEVSLEDRVASLAAEGIAFAVPTDHNHVTDYAPTIEALGLEGGMGTVPGVEVSTWAPQFGHFNAYPWERDPSDPRGGAPDFRGQSPRALFDELHSHAPDTIVQVNHPRLDEAIGYLEQLGFTPGSSLPGGQAGFDAIEVWNGFELGTPEALDRNLRDWMALLALGVRVTATGNSDSHHVHGQWAGYPRTYVRVPRAQGSGAGLDGRAVVRALRHGAAFVTSGPLLEVRVNGARPGEAAPVRGGAARVEVEARAPAWMDLATVEVYVGGARVHTERVSPRRLEHAIVLARSFEVSADPGSFVIVLVRGEEPMDRLLAPREVLPVAFTNPVWLE